MGSAPNSNIDFMSEALKVAHSFVPLSSMKYGFFEHLLKYACIDLKCAGDVLFKRGDTLAKHYYLLSGQLKNVYASGHIELIRASDHIYPVVDEMPRPCTCVAKTDATVISFDSDRLDCILSWSQISEYLLSILSTERDLDEDIDWIKTVLNSNLFYKVPPVNAEHILRKMKPLEVSAGEVVVREGEIGDCCYFIKEGEAQVTKKDDEGQDFLIAEIGPGRCFGEDALVYETLRNATVAMQTDGVLMKLSKDDFKLLLKEPAIEEVTENNLGGYSEPPVFIDVRTEEEYEKGHLSLAANIPLHLLGLKQRLLRPHVPYVLYCDTGRRSKAAAYLLGKQGFNALALQGGLVGAGMQYQLVNDFSYVLRDGRVMRG